jgi:hypothetical protein
MANLLEFTASLKDMMTPGLRKIAGLEDKVRHDVERPMRAKVDTSQAEGGLSKLSGMFGKIAGVAAAAFAVDKIASFGSGVVNTLATFEKYEAVLTNTFGDNAKAQESMKMIQDFASSTPFSVDELTDSFVKLTNRGLQPAEDELRKYGDLASSVGKPFDQLTEAVLDATTGEFERLKDFGIKARKEGDKIAFTFKGQTAEVQNSEQAIKDYILSLGEMEGVAGAMEAISGTVGGMLSNLGDKFTALQLRIGKAFKPLIADGIGLIAGWFDKMGDTADWIGNRVERLKKVFAPITNAIQPIIAAFDRLKLAVMGTDSQGAFLAKTFTVLGNIFAFIEPALVAFGDLVASQIDNFREWGTAITTFIQKHENIQRFLAGMGNAFVYTFKTIATTAKNILGGVGDLIVGIVTLDLDRIKEGSSQLGSAFKEGNFVSMGIGSAKAFKEGWDNGVSIKQFGLGAWEGEGDPYATNNSESKTKSQKGGTPQDSLSAGLAGISGAKGEKSIVINIDKLIEKIEIKATTIREGAEDIKRQVTEAIMSALNDAQVIGG